jgi:hypothetical protein
MGILKKLYAKAGTGLLVRDRDRWRAVVSTVMNLWIP